MRRHVALSVAKMSLTLDDSSHCTLHFGIRETFSLSSVRRKSPLYGSSLLSPCFSFFFITFLLLFYSRLYWTIQHPFSHRISLMIFLSYSLSFLVLLHIFRRSSSLWVRYDNNLSFFCDVLNYSLAITTIS